MGAVEKEWERGGRGRDEEEFSMILDSVCRILCRRSLCISAAADEKAPGYEITGWSPG